MLKALFARVVFRRAGNQELKKYFQDQIKNKLEDRLTLSQRVVGQNDLSEEQKAIYYSSWLYKAIHFAISISDLQSREALKQAFRLDPNKLEEVLKFLVEAGLIADEKGRLKVRVFNILLSNKSKWIIKHHTNWRLRAIENFEHEKINELHYSGVYTLSEADAIKLKDHLLEAIKKNVEIVQPSKEEKMYCCNIDLFDLLKR